MHPTPETPPYDILGGEEKLRSLVNRFYQVMDNEPRAQEIRTMHPQDLKESEDKLFMFLSGWLGGPELYVKKHGSPMLRRRHMPFTIDASAAGQWMLCMRIAMKEENLSPTMYQYLDQALGNTARHMINQSPMQA